VSSQKFFTETARQTGGGFTDRRHSLFIEAHLTGRTSWTLELKEEP
jgi:hypothetical protein